MPRRRKWQAEMMPWPVLTMLAGFMLSPLFFSSLVQSQAGSFCVMGLTLPLLFQLPDVASTRQPVPSWSVAQLRPMLPVVLCAALQGVRNLCRETLLGPSLIIRFMPDYWSWAQMNVAGVFGGVVGQSMSLVMLQQPANPGFIAVLMALCPILFLIELMTSSYKVLLLATFCSALLKVLTAPMFWKICGLPDGQLQVCQQAFAFFDGVLGFVVPLSTLAVTTSVSPYGGAALLTVSGVVLPALAWRLPAEKRD
ncbi:unnamed protein product [Effrenium voratum]|nr:unnamed protein product [Effrenium voratum]